ncbi:MAG: hypothetical protein K2J11_12350 [Oscillospiraceae bacterium]|nr:hypothetical protein [Oscillospiraceae bacterium]
METITFMLSVIAFYIKGEITAEQNFVRFKIRHRLGLIPLDSSDERIPITQISLVRMTHRIRLFWFVVGSFLTFISACIFVFNELPFFMSVPLLLLSIAMLVSSFRKCLVIDLTSGRVISIPFVIFEWNKANRAAELINELISNRIDDTNVRIHTDRSIGDNREQTDRVVNAIKGLENKLK